MKSKYKVLFFGSSLFSSIIEEGLNDYVDILYSVIKSEKVLLYKESKKLKIPTILYENVDKVISESDFCVVASFGNIIPKNLLDKSIFLNIHPSLLPLYRGATPIQSVILNGDKYTGVSIIKMNENMDEGDVYLQKKIELKGNETYNYLEKTLAQKSVSMIFDVISNYESIIPIKQDSSKSTYCNKKNFLRENVKINWDENSLNIIRLIKAASPAWCYFNNKIINIKDAELTDIKSQKSGEIFLQSKDLLIAGADFYIKINDIQKEGGVYMNGREFKNGISNRQILHFN